MRKKIKFYKQLLAEICETLCTICLDRSTDKFASGGRYREVYRDHFEKLKEFSRILRE